MKSVPVKLSAVPAVPSGTVDAMGVQPAGTGYRNVSAQLFTGSTLLAAGTRCGQSALSYAQVAQSWLQGNDAGNQRSAMHR